MRSRLGGRLEPLSRVNLVLHEGRGELCTVSQADTVHAHRRCASGAPRWSAAPRPARRCCGCSTPRSPTARLQPALQRARAARRRSAGGHAARRRSRSGPQAAAGRRLRARAVRAARPAARREHLGGVLPAARAAWSAPAARPGSFPLAPGGARASWSRRWRARWPRRRRRTSAPWPGRPRDGRDARAPRARPVETGAGRRGQWRAYPRRAGHLGSRRGRRRHEARLRLRRGLARDARAARRQGRQRRRDDPRARRRAGAGGLHDHHRGLRRLHARRPRGARGPRGAGGRGARHVWRSEPASGSATRRIRCSSRCARARASRCRACSTPSSTSA